MLVETCFYCVRIFTLMKILSRIMISQCYFHILHYLICFYIFTYIVIFMIVVVMADRILYVLKAKLFDSFFFFFFILHFLVSVASQKGLMELEAEWKIKSSSVNLALFTPMFTFLGIKWFLRDFQCLKGRIRKTGRNVLLQKKTDKDTLRKPFDPGSLLKDIDIKTVRR